MLFAQFTACGGPASPGKGIGSDEEIVDDRPTANDKPTIPENVAEGIENLRQEERVKASVYERTSILPAAIMFLVCATYGSITGFLSLYATNAGISNIGVFCGHCGTLLLHLLYTQEGCSINSI